MTDRWPSIARVSAADSACTILLTVKPTTMTCKAHADVSPETITWTDASETPLDDSNGNGHPEQNAATWWARCPTCDRLFMVVPSPTEAWKRVSHYIDVETGLKDSYMHEANPTTNYESDTEVQWGGTAGGRKHPVYEIPRVDGLLPHPTNARIIKAELQGYLTTVSGATTAPLYRILQAATLAGVTWNKYDGSNDWDAPGALTADVDYDSTLLANQSFVATGWNSVAAGNDFRDEISARRASTWAIGCIGPGDGSVVMKSREAASDKPRLRIWYEC